MPNCICCSKMTTPIAAMIFFLMEADTTSWLIKMKHESRINWLFHFRTKLDSSKLWSKSVFKIDTIAMKWINYKVITMSLPRATVKKDEGLNLWWFTFINYSHFQNIVRSILTRAFLSIFWWPAQWTKTVEIRCTYCMISRQIDFGEKWPTICRRIWCDTVWWPKLKIFPPKSR